MDISYFKRMFEKNNYKFTKQKQLILDVIIKSPVHLSAKEIYEKVKDKNIGLATVYRTLKLFKKLGIIKEINVSGVSYYEMKMFSKNPLHIHFKCLNCGKTIDINSKISVEYVKLNNRLEEENNIEIHDMDMMLYGLCNICREELKCQGQLNLEE
ncbi:Fe2+ or Zn2+ uptake regulation protein [Caloramator fervidus]|uniref:Fe2+ or Zn2+ uptake regulation protein n=1 Tax=Caloramator fervidus TaxID=29344 RepID=A0A1H5TKY9_9CLOT|nr:transcriptional repressor [Caloramator fervidus]SEF63459.1 Fe2+ or Zn2+ uptake regulation protein [Caloramator fervidus]